MALKLPIYLTSKRDVLKLRREVEVVADSLLQQRVAKEKAGVDRKMKEPSAELRGFLEANSIEYSEDKLDEIEKTLASVYENAIQIRMSFASEPEKESLEKLVGWFRDNVTPAIFIQVGIQPRIAGGVILRTNHKRYDFSLRSMLLKNSDKLMKAVHDVGK